MKSARIVTVLSAVVGLSLSGIVARAAEPKPVRPFYNHFTDEDEARIGNAIAEKIEKEGVSVPGANGQATTARTKRNVLLEAYLESIASKLGNASQRPQVPYTVRVIDAPNVVNAMSFPGGYLYIYSGLLDFVQSESELSAVLAHEIGHVVGRHAMNRIARLNTLAGLIDQARGANLIKDDQTAQKIAELVMPILESADAHSFYSRDNEIEADLLGFHEMLRAGWNPRGESALLARLAKGSPKAGLLSALLATHPDPSDRLSVVDKETQQVRLSPELIDSSLQFRTMKLGLSVGL